MNLQKDQAKVKGFFEDLLKKHGVSFKSLGYKAKESQLIRFAILAQVGDLNHSSILDVGCGFAEFYDFLREQGLQVDYHGCDVSAEMIAIARKSHPKLHLEVVDFLKWESAQTWDYVISSGINNIKTSTNLEFCRKLIEKMFALCKVGVAVNMLSAYASSHDPKSYYAQPEDIFGFCMELTNRVVLRHDYKPNDFTLYLYK